MRQVGSRQQQQQLHVCMASDLGNTLQESLRLPAPPARLHAVSAQCWPAVSCARHACAMCAGADMHACLVLQAKELEACAAAKARLEEAFSRSMSELR